jgi:hypothetical protein
MLHNKDNRERMLHNKDNRERMLHNKDNRECYIIKTIERECYIIKTIERECYTINIPVDEPVQELGEINMTFEGDTVQAQHTGATEGVASAVNPMYQE